MPLAGAQRHAINQKLKNPPWRRLALEALEVLDGGPALYVNLDDERTLEIPFLDIYCQTSREQFVHFEDLVITAIRWQHVLNGSLIYRFIQLARPPFPDADVEHNRELLHQMVAQYQERGAYGLVDADFWGGKMGEDGFVKFEAPFIVGFEGGTTDSAGKLETRSLESPVDGVCTVFPLEVGYCMPDQMEMHLLQQGCVARFPYEHDIMVFLELRDRTDWWSA